MGSAFVALAAVVGVVLLLLFLPAIALGLVEVIVVGTLFGTALVAATLFGRPVLVRASEDDSGASVVWTVKGWRASREVRDHVVAAVDAGLDPLGAVDVRAEFVAHRQGSEPDEEPS